MAHEPRHIALEAVLVKERAAGLGLTGERLNKAIQDYERSVARSGASDARSEALLRIVGEKAQELLIQREMNGFLHENLSWLLKAYRIPQTLARRWGA